MNEMKPRFIEGSVLQKEYYEQTSPYVNTQSCNVNLLELSRYAKKHNKKLVELTREEVNRFSI